MTSPGDSGKDDHADDDQYADPTSTEQAPERRQQLRERAATELVEDDPDSRPRLTPEQIAEVRDRISGVGKPSGED